MTDVSTGIRVGIVDGIASVEIDNPARRNALTKSMCLELQHVMLRLDADPDVVVITLSGRGITFCAGAALDEITSVLLDPQDDGTFVDHLSAADHAISSAAKPTVAIVDGPCMGGGWQIAAACDFIVASERSIFAITPAKLGIIYPRSGIERLIRLVGPATAKFLLFTGRSLTATQAFDVGLVAHVIPDDDFAEDSDALVSSLRDNSQFSIHTLKHLVDRTTADDPHLADEWVRAWQAAAEGPDMAIGIDAFVGRERPKFAWGPA
ncbi:enoyl-CoA hydratase/isomerase family protein [Microbacterium deminutum]